MGFAACTNEVEEFTSQTQTKDYPGVELGEDFVINVTQSDFAADAETRAELEKNGIDWVASWNKGDTIGAAWFNKFKYDEEGKIVDPKDVYTSLDEYGSNAAFVHQEGSIFKSEAISKLGAYVLYYPYNLAITDNMTEIPVKEIPDTQEFDTKDVTAQVTKNITAASVAVFGKSQATASDFTIEQIPNLYEISFFIQEEAFLKLGEAARITHVMLEANDGAAIFNTNGKIGPDYDLASPEFEYVITAPDYIAEKLPKIAFVGDPSTCTSRITVEVKNADDEAYYINETGKDNASGKFYFSLLPTEVIPNKVTFKVVAKVGTSTKVFEKNVDLSAAQKAEGGFGWKMSQTGQHINLAVGLDRLLDEDGIYSEDQFIEYWEDEAESFDIKVPGLDLSEVEGLDFNLPEGKTVTIKGMPITLPSISGSYIFKNNVTVKGNANLVGAQVGESGNKATFEVTGDLTAENATFWGPVTVGDEEVKGSGILTSKSNVTFKNVATINGNVKVENGKLDIASNKTSKIAGKVTVYDKATLINRGVAINNALTINKGGKAELAGNYWSATAITVNGDLTFSGKGHISSTKNGKVTLGKLTVGKDGTLTNVKDGTITRMGDFVVAATVNAEDAITITAGIEEIGAIKADRIINFNAAKATTTKLSGDITANKAVTFGANVTISEESTANVVANADVTFNGEVKKIGNINGGITDDVVNPTTGKVTFAKTAVTNDINAGNEVVFNAAATTGAITANAGEKSVQFNGIAKTGAITANSAVLFNENATVDGAFEVNYTSVTVAASKTAEILGNITITGKEGAEATVNAANITVGKTVDDVFEGDYILALNGESELTAENLTVKDIAVNDMFSTLTVNNKLDVKGTLTANGKVIAPVKEASTISDLIIEPGITVDLSGATAVATINNLTTKTKGEYDGILLTSATKSTNIGSGTNSGKIEGSSSIIIYITGDFTINNEIQNKITVNKGAKLTIAYNHNNTISNSGEVVVNKDIKVTKAVSNSGNIKVYGELYGTNTNNGAIIDVKNGGKLILSGDNINTSTKKGYIYVERGSTVDANSKNTNNVAYIWEGINKPVDGTEPGQDITNIITQIDMNGATVEKMADIPTYVTSLNISGTWTLPAATSSTKALDFTAYGINVTDNAEFTSTGKCYVKNATVSVNTQKTLTVSDLFIFDSGCVVELEQDAKFSGNKNSATVSYK